MKIMVVEDDPKIRAELTHFLQGYRYEVEALDCFDDAAGRILASDADLVLLDLNLPGCDGFYICREVRKASAVPIIVVTSRDSALDELMSMNLGADDFITKPFHTQILLARIASVLRRAYPSGAQQTVSYGGLTLDLARGVVSAGDREAELTKNEQRIVHLLMRSGDAIVTRDALMNELWQSDEFVDDNTLTVNINRLRRKLEELGVPDYIKTKRGQGYRL